MMNLDDNMKSYLQMFNTNAFVLKKNITEQKPKLPTQPPSPKSDSDYDSDTKCLPNNEFISFSDSESASSSWESAILE